MASAIISQDEGTPPPLTAGYDEGAPLSLAPRYGAQGAVSLEAAMKPVVFVTANQDKRREVTRVLAGLDVR